MTRGGNESRRDSRRAANLRVARRQGSARRRRLRQQQRSQGADPLVTFCKCPRSASRRTQAGGAAQTELRVNSGGRDRLTPSLEAPVRCRRLRGYPRHKTGGPRCGRPRRCSSHRITVESPVIVGRSRFTHAVYRAGTAQDYPVRQAGLSGVRAIVPLGRRRNADGLCQISGHRWHRRSGFPLSSALRRHKPSALRSPTDGLETRRPRCRLTRWRPRSVFPFRFLTSLRYPRGLRRVTRYETRLTWRLAQSVSVSPATGSRSITTCRASLRRLPPYCSPTSPQSHPRCASGLAA